MCTKNGSVHWNWHDWVSYCTGLVVSIRTKYHYCRVISWRTIMNNQISYLITFHQTRFDSSRHLPPLSFSVMSSSSREIINLQVGWALPVHTEFFLTRCNIAGRPSRESSGGDVLEDASSRTWSRLRWGARDLLDTELSLLREKLQAYKGSDPLQLQRVRILVPKFQYCWLRKRNRSACTLAK